MIVGRRRGEEEVEKEGKEAKDKLSDSSCCQTPLRAVH